MKEKEPKKTKGRPRTFDKEEALRKAMYAFWRFGYEGASLSKLCELMDLTPPQIYNAFGSKELMFAEAVEFYGKSEISFVADILSRRESIKECLRHLFLQCAKFYSDPAKPLGCFSTVATFSATEANESVVAHLRGMRKGAQKMIADRLDLAQKAGEIPPTAEPAALGAYLMALLLGMSVQARDGATKKQLVAYADMALAALPTMKSESA
jgi:AcrR family transcriptional regulator